MVFQVLQGLPHSGCVVAKSCQGTVARFAQQAPDKSGLMAMVNAVAVTPVAQFASTPVFGPQEFIRGEANAVANPEVVALFP